MINARFRPLLGLALCAALAIPVTDAFARPGQGSSMGSRGSRTFSAPPSTNTAPTTAKPIERTITPPSQPSPGMQSPGMANPGMQAPRPPMTPPAQPSFARNMLMGVGAGLLGAGLFGMLSGSGFFSGLGSLGGLLGFLIQAALLFFIVRFAINYFRRRSEPAMAGGPALRQAPDQQARQYTGSGAGQRRPVNNDAVGISPQDFNAFEKLLYEVQAAYSIEDRAALQKIVTPEMMSYFNEAFSDNAAKGVRNDIGGVKLLQGDLSESWREGKIEYATVAMRFAITDTMLDRKTGRPVDGGTPSQVTELWTFVRDPAHDWTLSAIQQN